MLHDHWAKMSAAAWDDSFLAYGETVVFGIFERGGQVHTEIAWDCPKPAPQEMIRGGADAGAVMSSDGRRGDNGPVDLEHGHDRADHSKVEFARGPVHVNGIEDFRGRAKARLATFKGPPKHRFRPHLKETERRHHHRHSNIYKTLLAYPRKNPIS